MRLCLTLVVPNAACFSKLYGPESWRYNTAWPCTRRRNGAESVRLEECPQACASLVIYIEGQNIAIEYRYSEEKVDRHPDLAAELVRLKVDVIVTTGPTTTRPAKEATSTIPIVMAQDTDPVGNGFVVTLARPGGNITGLSSVAPEFSGKRLELLTEIVPGLSRVVVLWASTTPGSAQALREMERAAGYFRSEFVEDGGLMS